ncbi:NTP transferase domain-containing protein [Sneathiella glossodoripedis]|uniref:NTP transferase domain-containing protein n=1 Tax=Sneathiella glossodoripedis TaxID=418853 RepID=UPI000470EF8A|nr:molybdopterin-binding/glycosyltransferase family 2 protein [Sneathiella glossodoripedis]
MIFGRLEVTKAEGAILAHAVDMGESGLLKKGTILSQDMILTLKDHGITQVLAARLENEDMGEDQAAHEISAVLAGPNCSAEAPFTGRSNLISNASGVVRINRDLLNKINNINADITVATLKDMDAVEAGQMIATVKIIPFATKSDNVKSVIGYTELASQKLISVAPFKKKKIGVISTLLPHTPEKILKKSEKVLEDRLNSCANSISHRVQTIHHEEDLRNEIQEMKAKGCDLILIFGASAITDVRDVIPTALCQAGGKVLHFGMPVDPGNLLLLGSLDDTVVIGLPGCTRSPKLNGFDWVLQRILADIPVEATDIMNMGEGGLLKEISSRPQPRESRKTTGSRQPEIAALLLAAGRSRRMGPQNKLLALINDTPMVRHVAQTLMHSDLNEVLMVTGHEAEEVLKTVWDLNIPSVQNPNYSKGLSTSLKVGFEILKDRSDGILVCLGDMPFVSEQTIQKLIAKFDPANGKSIVIPTTNGKRGNPVLISTQYWPEIKNIAGDMGAKALISANDHAVETVEIDSREIFMDIDTPDVLATVTDAKKSSDNSE